MINLVGATVASLVVVLFLVLVVVRPGEETPVVADYQTIAADAQVDTRDSNQPPLSSTRGAVLS